MGMRVDGLLIVDKPEGITSLDVVREIKSRFNIKRAGHIGTLDPFATGVLPVAINEGTKLVPFLEEEPKEYEVIMKLGEETTTDDITGEVTLRRPWEHLTPESIHSAFHNLVGRIRQTPPMFSAIKVHGKPLYRLARKGIEVERREREVEIFNIEIEEINLPHIHFKVSCSKGTYIRSLGKEIGKRLDCAAHLIFLRRVRSGPFTLEKAISWEVLRSVSIAQDLKPWLITLNESLPSLPEIIGNKELVKKVRFGKGMIVKDILTHCLPSFQKGEWLKMISPEEGLVAILKSEVKYSDIPKTPLEWVAFRPLRIFHPPN